jgi:sugar lactone lactonase YvrE
MGPTRFLIAVVALLVVAPVAQASAPPTTVFAQVPSPGYPFALVPTDDAVYVTTSAGHPGRLSDGVDAVFKYAPGGGSLIGKANVTTGAEMGLYGAAEDGEGRIYVVDMNGRILRFTPHGRSLLGPEVYATDPYRSLGWQVSMWMLLAFDENGDLYVTDESMGAIWRIPPHGAPVVWFQDVRLRSDPLSGLNGIAVGPDHRLYFVLPRSEIYRLPLTRSSPSADQLELFHAYVPEAGDHPYPEPVPDDLAFGKSGRLYVSLFGSNQIGVLAPDGRDVRRIDVSGADGLLGLRFQGDSVLVANSNALAPENSSHWQILKVDVGEPGWPLIRPTIR